MINRELFCTFRSLHYRNLVDTISIMKMYKNIHISDNTLKMIDFKPVLMESDNSCFFTPLAYSNTA